MCGMNAVRSPIAELLARRMVPGAFVASAGVRAGERDPFVDAVLAEEGLFLAERQPRTIDDLEDGYFDLIVTLSPEAHHAALERTRSMAVELARRPDRGVGNARPDPGRYRDVRDRLKARIAGRFREEGREPGAD